MTLKLTKEQYDTFVFLKKYGITNALEKVFGKVTLGHGSWNHDLKPLNSVNKEKLVRAITGAIKVEVVDGQYLLTDGEYYVENLTASVDNENFYKKFILTKTGYKERAFRFPKDQYGVALDVLSEMGEDDFYAEEIKQ